MIWSGAVIDGRTNIPADLYLGHSYGGTAAASNTLALGFLNPSNVFYPDDVTVADAVVGAVPEPASLALPGTATAGSLGLRNNTRV